MVMVSVHKKNQLLAESRLCIDIHSLSLCSVRRRWKNVDSSSKSNPLRRRGKNNDASTWRRRRRRRKKWKKVDELSTKIRVIYLQQ